MLAGEAGAAVRRLTGGNGAIRYLKHGHGPVARDLADEADRLRWLAGRLPCAALLHFGRDDGEAWLLTSAVAGRSGDEWLDADPTCAIAVARGAGDFLRRMHALPIADCPFVATLPDRMAAARFNIDRGLVDTDDFDDEHEGWSAEDVWTKLQAIVPSGGDLAVTHGDFSLGNILFDAAGAVTGCIDVGRLGIADPYRDIAIMLNNLAEYGDDACRAFLKAYGLDTPDEDRLAFYRCLDEFF